MEWESGNEKFCGKNFNLYVDFYTHSLSTLLQVSPLYIAEIAPKEKRGLMVSLVNGFATTGSVVSHSILCYVSM